ncbi:MAG TPA: quinone-dependent dihydroorotate dehydrogenase [Ignavibacteria bacterium]|nr:quinone-dependent dihydroorotate dehydrogenase [Ignavibacteria bacterium]
MIYKIFIRPFLFLMDPESAHNCVLNFFSKVRIFDPLIKILYSPKNNEPIQVSDLAFRNKLGLSAGFDKNGAAIKFWDVLGFSHIEIGTVTPLSQSGNPKPRMFRLKKDSAVINRLGFNNKGADEIRKNILIAKKTLSKDFVIGINIGKNKDTPIENSISDYKICFEKLYDVADYFTLNISSPNTEKLRTLHESENLSELLSQIQLLNNELSQKFSKNIKPVFLKISPDINNINAQSVYENAVTHKLTGIIATNTTVSRSGLSEDINETGGLSGKPVKILSDEILNIFNELNKKNSGYKLILIGCGGIFNSSDVVDKIKKGAALVQIYTGFIYEGPSIIKKILN